MSNKVIKNLSYHHTAIVCGDIEKALRFYSEGLGFEYICEWGEGEGRKILLDLGNGERLELFAGGNDSAPDSGRIVHLAFLVEDVAQAYNAAIAAGATPYKPPFDPDLATKPFKLRFTTAFCYGPSGETLEFLKMKD